MGCAVSLQLEEVLRKARCKAVSEEQDQVGEILSSDENVKFLHSLPRGSIS
jgi:hypothetical protein